MSTLYSIVFTPIKLLVDVVVDRFSSKSNVQVDDIESPQTEIQVETPVNNSLQLKTYNFRPRKPVVYAE